MVIPNAIRPAEPGAIGDEKQELPSFPNEPLQRRSIFPGTASVRTTHEQPKPWNKSQWID